MRVLVVDDEPDVRLVARVTLKAAGIEVDEVGSGEEALVRLADGNIPDVMLLDIRMPGIDGWEVLRSLRSNGAFAAIPVVIFTAHASVRDADEFKELGQRSYVVTKPFQRDELIATVQQAAVVA